MGRPNKLLTALALALGLTSAPGCTNLGEPPLDQGTGTIRGQVTDGQGLAAPTVEVFVVGNLALYTKAGPDGGFSLSNVPAGTHQLVAIARPGAGTSATITVFGGRETTIKMALADLGALKGTITLEQATDHRGTQVFIPSTPFVAYTDAVGAFALSVVAPGCYPLRVEHPGFLPLVLDPICVPAGEAVSVQPLTLSRQGPRECSTDAQCGSHRRCQAGSCAFEEGFGPERCDGSDNDGDGSVDEDLAEPCGPDKGACKMGVSLCLGGHMSDCLGPIGPEAELCDDSLDNDCDGETDEEICANLRILFVIDGSGSMQEADRDHQRIAAVQEVVRHFAGNPAVLFDVIRFETKVRSLTGGFVSLKGDEPEVFGLAGLGGVDGLTDFQGALDLALHDLGQEIEKIGIAAKKTKVVILFLSDGNPSPTCLPCVTDPPSDPAYHPQCHPDWRIVCEICGEVLSLDLLQEGMLPALKPDTAYNSEPQILNLVDQLRTLVHDGKLGGVQLHTGLLYCRDEEGNPTLPTCDQWAEKYCVDPVASKALLRAMEGRGAGSYTLYLFGSPISFLQVDFSPFE